MGEIRSFGNGTARGVEVYVNVYKPGYTNPYQRGYAIIDTATIKPQKSAMFVYQTFAPEGVDVTELRAKVLIYFDTPK